EHKSLTYNNLIDKEGHLLFQKHYSFDNNFNEGCLPVFDDEAGKSYYIDINEKKVIPYDYVEASKFSDGNAPVWLNNEGYALIDHAGNIVRRLSEEEYYEYPFYNEGLVAYNTGKWNGSGDDLYRSGFKDRYGNIIIPAEFQNTSWSSGGLIGLTVNGFWGFVKNPLPQAAWSVDPALWQEDRTRIASVEGLPIYAGELESVAYNIKEGNPKLTGIPSYKKAFEQLKAEKAFEKYGETIDLDKIQYQIGNTYYRLLLLEKN
ncbi:MAG: WG repeat-containing protein, partial [Bacillota bacterium]